MYRLLTYTLLLVSCTFSLGILAQPANQLAPTVSDTSLLWRISGNGLSSDSYLFGTIHMIPADDYFLPQTVKDAMDLSDNIAFEIDPRDMEDPAMLMSIMGRINMRNDTSLNDLLTEAEYTIIADYFEKAGLPMMMFKRMKPLFLSAMVGQDMGDLMGGGKLSDGGRIKSYEMELTRIAQAGQKEISGLETMEFQLSLFDSIPYGAQAKMLLEAVKADGEESEEDDQFTQMVKMYKRQAIVEMASLIHDESSDVSHFEELLLTRRNLSWIAPMGELMRKQPSFFAVGAGHLAGDQGVITLLREAGYTVQAVYE